MRVHVTVCAVVARVCEQMVPPRRPLIQVPATASGPRLKDALSKFAAQSAFVASVGGPRVQGGPGSGSRGHGGSAVLQVDAPGVGQTFHTAVAPGARVSVRDWLSPTGPPRVRAGTAPAARVASSPAQASAAASVVDDDDESMASDVNTTPSGFSKGRWTEGAWAIDVRRAVPAIASRLTRP